MALFGEYMYILSILIYANSQHDAFNQVVIVPDKVDWTRNASMWVTGWSVTSGFPQHNDEDIALAASLAMGSNIVIGCLFQIPNEHTTFSGDPIQKSRSEDAIIGKKKVEIAFKHRVIVKMCI